MKTQTHRLYYDDAYLKTFTARVVERLKYAGRSALVLDRTAFYPTGGGQPHDLGRLGPIPVVDVIERESGGVLHVLAAELAADEVHGELDWARRFDHMQQHTGQHILSQAFVQIAHAETVGFHLGQDTLTIDLNRAGLAPSIIERAEELANQVVFEDRPVTARFVAPSELGALPLRAPPKVSQDIRVVQVEGFDVSACGGTHVARTGQIGLIKIVKVDRRGGESRVEFCCGGRALADYRRKHAVLTQASAGLSIGYEELGEAIARLQAEAKEARKKWSEAEGQLMLYEADELVASARPAGTLALVVRAWPDREAVHLRLVARRIVERPGMVALLGSSGGERSAFVFARSADVGVDMAAWLRQAAGRIGGKGGGQPDLAQGGAGPASVEQVQAALEWVADQLAGPGPGSAGAQTGV